MAWWRSKCRALLNSPDGNGRKGSLMMEGLFTPRNGIRILRINRIGMKIRTDISGTYEIGRYVLRGNEYIDCMQNAF